MRTILLVAALVAGCTTTPAAHEVDACGSGWSAFYSVMGSASFANGCERQCDNPPPGYGPGQTGPSCTIIDPTIDEGHGGPEGCIYSTFDDGSKGCCLPTGSGPVVFAECEAQ